MSVRFKLLLCLSGVVLVLWLCSAVLSQWVFLGRFDEMDGQRTVRNLARVTDYFTTRERQIASAIRLWQRTAQSTSDSPAASAAAFLREFDLNLLAVFDDTGRIQILETRGALEGAGKLTPSDEAKLAEISQFPGSGERVGLIETSLGPLLFGAVAAIPGVTGDTGPSVGGIFLNTAFEQELRRSLLDEISIAPAQGPLFERFRELSKGNDLPVVLPTSDKDQSITALAVVRDAFDQPLLILQVVENRHSYLQGIGKYRFFLGITGAFAIIVVLVGTLLVELLVTTRIRRLTHSARRMDVNGMSDLPQKFLDAGDEVGVLAKTTKAMLDRLKASQILYRAVVETQSELIVRFRPDGYITLANEAFADFFQRHVRAVVGKNISEFLTPELIGGRDILDTIPREVKRSVSEDLKLTFPDGRECWLQWIQRMVIDESSEVAEIQAAGHDITLRRDYEEKLRLAKENLEAAIRAKSEFLTVMSHETRTPLFSIQGFLSILRDTPLTRDQEEYLNLIESSSNNLLGLLNDLLDYSNVSSGKIGLNLTTISVVDLVQEVVAMQTPEVRVKDLDFDVDIEIDAPTHIEADGGRLRQVLNNLVSNAVKFTDHGFVRLSVRPEGDGQIAFVVQDTGIGIHKDKLDGLFEAFTLSDSSDARRHGGAGIGLAVCRRLLDMMEGAISVRSEAGLGSMFTITLPVGNPDPELATSSNLSHGGSDEHQTADISEMGLSALVVDDNPVNLKVIKFLLKKIGIAADTASSGKECLEKFGVARFDLVLMDVQMPDMDGYETVQRIRAHDDRMGDSHPNPYIIACTALSLPGDRERCIAAGMDDYVSKPVQARDLRRAIRVFLHQRNEAQINQMEGQQ